MIAAAADRLHRRQGHRRIFFDLLDGLHRPVFDSASAPGTLQSHLLVASRRRSFERHRTNYLVSRLISSAAAIEAAVTHTLRDMLREGFTLDRFAGGVVSI